MMRSAAGLFAGLAVAALTVMPLAAQQAAAPAPGQADAAPFDATITEACLSGRSDPSSRSGCIGIAAAHCLAASGEINDAPVYVRCYDAEAADWQARLTDVLGRLSSSGAASDTAEAAGPGSGRRAALEVAEAAWANWRDAECAFARRLAQGGGGEALAGASCVMRLTAERALMLEQTAQQQVGP
ncbi:DUF1311 domain-containing protein [Paracoccus suum]|uniref:DUF1311 domain-containing protein n=1 Tax=Paracoccus suum TaxID=2259340 RepID=A0A344PM88_9RHOB|nr:lysozyme inhibitor LprI family protein [Paracoccus suum]AXC50493.1 DUF1311 domain-containing protein [Paracoccus suum]